MTARAGPKTLPTCASQVPSVSPINPASQPQLLAWEVQLLGLKHEEQTTPIPAVMALPSPVERAKMTRKLCLEKVIQLARLNSNW